MWNQSGPLAANGSAAVADQVTEQPTVRVPASTLPKADAARKPAARKAGVARAVAITQLTAVALIVLAQTIILTISFIPATRTANLGWTATDGPFPTATAPLVTAFFYGAPFICGLLSRRWEYALVSATLPAWVSIGVYTVAASTQDGIFAFTKGAEPSYMVGTLEFFAALGAFGWLMRRIVLLQRPGNAG
jgi:hypothetical protein